MLLFEEKSRNYEKPMKASEDYYRYLDKISLEWGNQVRDILNIWFSHLPVEEQTEMKRRFQKDDFQAAFFELFLHELFLKLGYKITIHPDIDGQEKHPDFLLEKDDFKFYLEAKLCHFKSKEEAKRDGRKYKLYDELDKLSSEKYFLSVEEIKFFDNNEPSVRKIKSFLKKELNRLEKLDINTENWNDPVYEDEFMINYEDDRIKISFKPIPKIVPTKTEKLIGKWDVETEYSHFINSFRNSVKSKVVRYGDLKTPYIIAVNIFEPLVSTDEIIDALFGKRVFLYNVSNDEVRSSRKNDGIIYSKRGIQNKRVSGILTFFSILDTNLYNKNLKRKRMILFHHPWAKYPFPKETLPADEFFVVNDIYQPVEKNINLYDILFTEDI